MAHGKKYQDAAKLVDHDAVYPPAEAAAAHTPRRPLSTVFTVEDAG